MAVTFHNNQINFKLKDKLKVKNWLKSLALSHQKKLGEIAFIFCSDQALLKVNKSYLNHDTLTDIITFNYNENNVLNGDIFISIERIQENAIKFSVEPIDELHRVMAHGILHLVGFNDKNKQQAEEMRKQEDISLTLRNF
jgi:probable rRNA maturation factor